MIFERIKSAIAELISKIKKAYKNVKPETLEGQIVASMLDEYETIQQMFVKALAGASENFKNAEVDTAQNTSSENKFSLRGINENGIEVYETSEDVLKLPWKERKTRYLDLMKNEFRGRTAKFERNGHYYYAEFDRKSLSKAVYGEKRSDKKGHDALVNIGADGDVFDLVENSRYTGSEVDKKNHPKADYFDYFVKTVQINNTVFDVLADVQKQYGKNGGYVYTITLTENKSVKASPIREGQEASLKNSGNALTDETRIPQNGTDVNTSISEKGVKYSFAGREAKTSDIKTLEAAIRLEDVGKATSEEIRQQTGWFRGMDGKWRFEISDRDIEIDTTGKFHTNPDVRRYMELFDKVFVNMNASEEEATELRGLDKNLKGVSFEPRTLGELIKHDKLFAAYPQLKEISVHFADIDERGIYDPISKILVLQSKLKFDKSKLEKTLIHEIQHAIQDIEGFASGSSPDSWQVAGVSKEDAYSYYERTAGEIEARDAATRSWRTDEARKEKRPDIDRTDVVFADVRYSARDYSYDALVSKPDMKVTTLYDFDQHDRKDVVKEAKKNATSVGKANSDGSVSVYVDDVKKEVVLSTKGLQHGLDRRFSEMAAVTLKAGEIIKNSIMINELISAKKEAEKSYVLIGSAQSQKGELYIVRSVVNVFSNELLSMDVLYAINAKRNGMAVLNAPRVSTPSYHTTISIRSLLDYVNKYFPDILPEDVLRHYGHKARPEGELGESALFSDRDPDALTPRNLLANALEESAVHEVEKKKLAEYKENIGKLYEKEQELYEVRKEIKELSFAPGKKDTAKIKKLQDKAVKLSNSVTFYDKKLLNLESTSFLKNVLEREKQKAIRRQKEKDAERLKAQKEKALQKEKEITERYRASRKKAVESRNKTAMRNKIKRVVNELNQYLLHGTKDKHVMDNMKKVVAEALSILDMDTVGADERVEKYNKHCSYPDTKRKNKAQESIQNSVNVRSFLPDSAGDMAV